MDGDASQPTDDNATAHARLAYLGTTIQRTKLDRYEALLARLDSRQRAAMIARLERSYEWDGVATVAGQSNGEVARALVTETLSRMVGGESDSHVRKLAQRIAERSEIDWEAEYENAAGVAKRERIARLRLVDEIASACELSPAPPTRLGNFEILEKLGHGGNGVVYRARHHRLPMEVAVKVLAPGVLENSQARNRLRLEARALARLKHPHIATLHDFGTDGGVDYIAMELVEGDDLATRLSEGPLSPAEAVRLAQQVAQGLEAAHAEAIVHRDLKPSNVKLTRDDRAKLLDFGLAKRWRSGTEIDESATETGGTLAGTLLGTVPYMSPEQARGQDVDHRSDIWSFGCLLYEMLTGQRAFAGKTIPDTLASILDREPDWDALPEKITANVRRLLQRCLHKDIAQRLQAIGEARIALERDQESLTRADRELVTIPTWRRAVPLTMAVAIAAVAMIAWIWKPQPPGEPPPTTRFVVSMPEGERLASFYRPGFALSPDGRKLAFVAAEWDWEESWNLPPQHPRIYIRDLQAWEAEPMPGTHGGIWPTFSPDGQWIAFATLEEGLKKVPVDGGPAVTLCQCDASYGLHWGDARRIVFAGMRGGLRAVSPSGGEPKAITSPRNAEVSHRLPHALPGGQSILYTAVSHKVVHVDWQRSRIYVESLRTGQRNVLIEGGSDARYLPSGHLAFVRDGRLMVAPFDLRRLELSGPELPVLEGVGHAIHTPHWRMETGSGLFSLAGGTLAYVKGSTFPEIKLEVNWIDRLGKKEPSGVEPRQYLNVRVSADGKRLLLALHHLPTQVWVYDIERQTTTRQTFQGNTNYAIWGPGPEGLTFGSDHEGPNGIYQKTLDSGPLDPAVLVRGSGYPEPSSWSSDGSFAYVVGNPEGTEHDIWVRTIEDEVKPFISTRFTESYPSFSPDGRWLVYASDESGRREIYVRAYPGPGRALQISKAGGREPAWSRDGREIFYREGNKMLAVPMRVDGDRLHPGVPTELLEWPYWFANPVRSWDIGPDGRFLVIDDTRANYEPVVELFAPDRIHVVQNWLSELERIADDAQ